MTQYWNDTTLPWQSWDGTDIVWKNPAMTWNDNTLPWKDGSASVIGGGASTGQAIGLLLALTKAS